MDMHEGLKICRRQLRVGSSPTSATIYISHSEIFSSKIHRYHLHAARHLKAESSLVAAQIGTANGFIAELKVSADLP
jgi:hypothetical protein